ncbi:MAG: hypothetical protein JNL21_23100 [Myxococcales bacterium]|nr:hypothetical protein [Myxococcales bacterium]
MRRTTALLLLWMGSGCGAAQPATGAPNDTRAIGTESELPAGGSGTASTGDTAATALAPPSPPGDKKAAEPMTVTLHLQVEKSRASSPKKKEPRSDDDIQGGEGNGSEVVGQSASTEQRQGSLKREQVEAVLTKHRGDFSPCLKEDAVVRIEATISTSGAVADVTSERSTPDDAKLRECVTKAFAKLTFPTDWAQPGSTDGTRLSLDLRLKKEDDE